jgi:hypothetical protein
MGREKERESRERVSRSRHGAHPSHAPTTPSGLGMSSPPPELETPDEDYRAPGTTTHKDAARIITGISAPVQALADDASVLPVPNHVVLHHLSTSAIRNGVLAVGNTTRYRKKVCVLI